MPFFRLPDVKLARAGPALIATERVGPPALTDVSQSALWRERAPPTERRSERDQLDRRGRSVDNSVRRRSLRTQIVWPLSSCAVLVSSRCRLPRCARLGFTPPRR